MFLAIKINWGGSLGPFFAFLGSDFDLRYFASKSRPNQFRRYILRLGGHINPYLPPMGSFFNFGVDHFSVIFIYIRNSLYNRKNRF